MENGFSGIAQPYDPGSMIEPFVTMPASQLASVGLLIVVSVICLSIIALWNTLFPERKKRK